MNVFSERPVNTLSFADQMVHDEDQGDHPCTPEDGEGDGLKGGAVVAALAAGPVVEVHVVVADQVEDHLRGLGQRQITAQTSSIVVGD